MLNKALERTKEELEENGAEEMETHTTTDMPASDNQVCSEWGGGDGDSWIYNH